MIRRVVHDSHVMRGSLGALVGVAIVGLCWSDSHLNQGSKTWAIVAIVAMCAVLGDAVPDVARLLPGPGAFTVANLAVLAAIYGCVPETDQIPTVGLIVGTVGVIEIITWRPMAVAWHAVAAGLVMWAGVFGATGRDRAFVGALFAFWPMVLLAGLFRIVKRLGWAAPTVRGAVVACGVAAAIAVARTGALQSGRAPALRDAAVAAAASLLASTCVVVASTPARPTRPMP